MCVCVVKNYEFKPSPVDEEVLWLIQVVVGRKEETGNVVVWRLSDEILGRGLM